MFIYFLYNFGQGLDRLTSQEARAAFLCGQRSTSVHARGSSNQLAGFSLLQLPSYVAAAGFFLFPGPSC